MSPSRSPIFKCGWGSSRQAKLGDIGGVLRNYEWEVFYCFTEAVAVKDSNEAEVLAALEALRIVSPSLHEALIVESYLSNALCGL